MPARTCLRSLCCEQEQEQTRSERRSGTCVSTLTTMPMSPSRRELLALIQLSAERALVVPVDHEGSVSESSHGRPAARQGSLKRRPNMKDQTSVRRCLSMTAAEPAGSTSTAPPSAALAGSTVSTPPSTPPRRQQDAAPLHVSSYALAGSAANADPSATQAADEQHWREQTGGWRGLSPASQDSPVPRTRTHSLVSTRPSLPEQMNTHTMDDAAKSAIERPPPAGLGPAEDAEPEIIVIPCGQCHAFLRFEVPCIDHSALQRHSAHGTVPSVIVPSSKSPRKRPAPIHVRMVCPKCRSPHYVRVRPRVMLSSPQPVPSTAAAAPPLPMSAALYSPGAHHDALSSPSSTTRQSSSTPATVSTSGDNGLNGWNYSHSPASTMIAVMPRAPPLIQTRLPGRRAHTDGMRATRVELPAQRGRRPPTADAAVSRAAAVQATTADERALAYDDGLASNAHVDADVQCGCECGCLRFMYAAPGPATAARQRRLQQRRLRKQLDGYQEEPHRDRPTSEEEVQVAMQAF